MAKPSPICSADEFEARYWKPKPGMALVVGSKIYRTRTDRRLRHAHVIGADMEAGAGVDRVLDLEEAMPADFGPFAHIDCISVLEHSRRPWLLAANLERLLAPGGTLFVQAPFIWRLHSYPADLWRFTVEGIRALLPGIKWHALQYIHGLPQDGIPNLWHENLLYFVRTEVIGFGECAS